ncbi:MAG: DNA replication protein DnaC, partial [Limisphaerales bacterium]
EQRAAERRIRAAKFPVLKTLESFDFKAQASINEAVVRELMRGEYIDRKENVLLIGNPGTGKSHLATALAQVLYFVWVSIATLLQLCMTWKNWG